MPSLESLWNSTPFWGIVGGVIGIISLVLAVFFFYAGRKRKILEYQIISTPLITKNVASIPGLKVTINDQPVKTLMSTTIRFFNKGSEKIEPTDFAPLEPLGVSASSGILHLHLEADTSSHKSQNMNLRSELIDNKTANITFDFFRPKTNFSATVMHEGNLSISGDLKDGKVRTYREKSRFPFFLSLLFMCLSLMLLTLSGTSYESVLMDISSSPATIPSITITDIIIAIEIIIEITITITIIFLIITFKNKTNDS